MKKLYTAALLITLLSAGSLLRAQTQIKITIDTKTWTNIDCNLGADGLGGASPISRVYMHSGLCTQSKSFCDAEIAPDTSGAWQHVSGNWGLTPQDDGVGEMTNEGNGVHSFSMIIEDYYTDPSKVDTTESTLMPQGATPYVLGIVFRDSAGTPSMTGRDKNCKDIFIKDLDTMNPSVVNGSDGSPFNCVTVQRIATGIPETVVRNLSVYPNPANDFLRIRYQLKETTEKATVKILNLLGQEVATVASGIQMAGTQDFAWNTASLQSGVYIVQIAGATGVMATEKLVIAH